MAVLPGRPHHCLSSGRCCSGSLPGCAVELGAQAWTLPNNVLVVPPCRALQAAAHPTSASCPFRRWSRQTWERESGCWCMRARAGWAAWPSSSASCAGPMSSPPAPARASPTSRCVKLHNGEPCTAVGALPVNEWHSALGASSFLAWVLMLPVQPGSCSLPVYGIAVWWPAIQHCKLRCCRTFCTSPQGCSSSLCSMSQVSGCLQLLCI